MEKKLNLVARLHLHVLPPPPPRNKHEFNGDVLQSLINRAETDLQLDDPQLQNSILDAEEQKKHKTSTTLSDWPCQQMQI